MFNFKSYLFFSRENKNRKNGGFNTRRLFNSAVISIVREGGWKSRKGPTIAPIKTLATSHVRDTSCVYRRWTRVRARVCTVARTC